MSLRYGMVGGGPGAMIGEAHRMAARAAGMELVAGAFSSVPAKSAQQAEASGLAASRGFAGWPALIAAAGDLGLEAVVIVTPNHLHAAPAIAALQAGLHVMCDKPLATSLSEARAIAAAAGEAGRLVGVTYTFAGYAALRLAGDLVRAGEIGAVRLVQAEYFQDWLTERLEESGRAAAAWRTDPARSGPAGATADLGTHLWQVLGMVTGETPAAISADLTALAAGRALDDTGLVRLRYRDGARGQLAVTQAAVCGGGGMRIQVMGDKAGLAWSMAAPFELKRLGPGGAVETVTVPADGPFSALKGPPPGFLDAFAAAYRAFAAAIKGEGAPLAGIAEGVSGMAFVEAAVASSRAEGAWVSL